MIIITMGFRNNEKNIELSGEVQQGKLKLT